MLGTMTKQPADNLDYDIDFSPWLPQGDMIIGIDTKVEPDTPDGAKVHTAQTSPDNLVVKLWLNGGETGETYKITVTVSTLQSRVKETEFRVRVRDC